jgi:hypothetical protein
LRGLIWGFVREYRFSLLAYALHKELETRWQPCIWAPDKTEQSTRNKTMKLNHIITLCAMTATLVFSGTSLLAQDNGGNGGGNGGDQNGGQRRNRGNFDPAQMQQRIMDNIQDQLGFTNDTDWEAVKPLVQKVLDARRDVGFGGMRALFGRPRNGGGGGGQGGGGRGGMFGTPPGPEQEALQNALDANAPSSQIKDLLAKYKKAQKAKQAKLEAAQSDLKSVLTARQEAQAYLLELVN